MERPDAGTGLLASTAAVLVFVVLLLFAVQLLFTLHARTQVTAAAYEAAQRAAAAGAARSPDDVETYGDEALRSLGSLATADDAAIEWRFDDVDADGRPDAVEVRVTLPTPRILPTRFGGTLGVDVIRETARVRLEGPVE